jgi:hypothetical protein
MISLEMLPFFGSPAQLLAVANTLWPRGVGSGSDDAHATVRLGNGEWGQIQVISTPDGRATLYVRTANGRWNTELRKIWDVLHAELVRQGLLKPIRLPYKAIFPLDFDTVTTLIPQYFPQLRLLMSRATFRVWNVSNCSLRVAPLPDAHTELVLQFQDGEKPDTIAQDVWEKLADYLTNRYIESALRESGGIDDGQPTPASATGTTPSKRRRGGPRPTSDEEKLKIVTEWLRVEGDELQEIFCHRKSIGVSTLRQWINDLKARGMLAAS